MTLAAGQKLGPYEILAPLGAGGMGEVYRARDARLERVVALKVLPEELFGDKDRRRRFEQEARLLAALNHPNIAAVHSFEEIPGSEGSAARHVLSMELIEGKSLRETLAAGALPVEEAPRPLRTDRRRPREGARGRHRPPRPEARERHGHEGRASSRSSTSASRSS